MTIADTLVCLLTLLNLGACAGYTCVGNWNQGVYWFGAALLTGSVAWRNIVP